MYTVALFKNQDGDCYVYYSNSKSNMAKSDIMQIEDIESLGYKFQSCIITTDKVLSLKTRLKFRIQELRALKPDVNYYGYDEALISQIGLITSRLLRRGVEVTDEIALQCCDIRNSKRI